MTKVWLLLLGAVAAMSFALVVLVVLPALTIPREFEVGGPRPYTPDELEGRAIYIREGCLYCHTQQVRDATFTSDEARGWGRPSVPADYIHDRPHLLGTMRTGPDLINVGARIPDRQWHLVHLYQPRAVVPWSIMPGYPYLFEVKERAAPGDTVVRVPEPYGEEGKVVVARREAEVLVDYLLSLDRTYEAPDPWGREPEAAEEEDGG